MMKKLLIFSILAILLFVGIGFFLLNKSPETQEDTSQAIPLKVEGIDKNILLKNPHYANNDLDAIFDEQLENNVLRFDLKSHPSVDYIRQVGAGNQVVMFYDVNSVYQLENALGEPEFIDVRSGEQVDREWKYVVWGNESYESPVYSETTSENGTIIIEQTSTETKTREAWIDYNSRNLPKGQIRIGIEVNNLNGDRLDGVWTVGGKRIDRHAVWQASLDDAIAWWALENTTDVTGNGNTLTGTNSPTFSAGKVNDAINLTSSQYATDGNLLSGYTEMSMGAWVNLNQTGAVFRRILSKTDSATYNQFLRKTDGDVFQAAISTTSSEVQPTGTTTISAGTWYFVVVTYDGSTARLYVNGVNEANSSVTGNLKTQSENLVIGSEPTGENWVGKIDEAFVYNRSLTTDEIQILYNNGDGCTYRLCDPDLIINLILISPANNTGFATNNINFSANVTKSTAIGIANVSLVIDGVINQTNTSGVSGIYNFSQTLIDGDYNWTVIAFGNDSVQYNATNGTLFFTIDTVAPQITISSPATGTNFDYLVQGNNLTLNVTVDDDNLDACFYEYNGTNTTFSCSNGVLSQNNLTLTNETTVIVWANDTLGTLNNSQSTWTFTVFDFDDYTFESSVVEVTNSIFTGNFQTGSTLTSSFLEYNNTNTSTTINNLGGTIYELSATVTTPSVAADTNISWNFWVNNIEADSFNQTVTNLLIDNCSSFSNVIFNFTIYDEEAPTTQLTNITADYAFNIQNPSRTAIVVSTNDTTGSNPFEICLNSPLTNTLSLDGSVRHFANQSGTNYAIRFYNFLNETISNSTTPQNISLYGINSSKSLPFLLTFRDSNLALAPNLLVQVHKQFLPSNDFKIVEIPKTDTNGQTILNLIRNTDVYNLIMINTAGEVVASFTNIIAFCQDFTIQSCSIDLAATSEGQTSYNYSEDIAISYTLSYSNNTKLISWAFNSLNGSNQNLNMIVTSPNQFENRSVCNTSLVSASGTLTCNVSSFLDTNQFFYVELSSNNVYIETATINANPSLEALGGVLGSNGFFFALLLMLFLVLLFSDDKQVLVIVLGLGWATVGALGLIRGALIGTGSAGIWLIITIIIFMWKLKDEEGQ